MVEKIFEILIVDDNPENLRVLSTLLKAEGYNVRVAKDGNQALTSISESEPDMVILDIHMPKMDGFEVCTKIKANTNSDQFPVIFISALGDTFNKKQGFEVGAIDYITKPFDAEEVRARIKVHLQFKNSLHELSQLKTLLKNKDEEIKRLKATLRRDA